MALKFRLKGLAETFVESITCPGCGTQGSDDQFFSTELTKVTYDGIVVVAQCKCCQQIFVPDGQRLGVLDARALRGAVAKDSVDSGEPILPGVQDVRLNAERINAERRGEVH
jgi:hypothetical protein